MVIITDKPVKAADRLYNEFLEELICRMRKKLGKEYEVSIHSVRRNNNIAEDTMTVRKKDQAAAPLIYLGRYYEVYRKGLDFDAITEMICSGFLNPDIASSFDMSFFTDWEKVKDRIVCRLVGTENNRKLLESLPHTPFLDMAVIYHYQFEPFNDSDQDETVSAGIAIVNEYLKLWKISLEELHRKAVENTGRLCPADFRSMNSVMEELTGKKLDEPAADEVLYVLTNIQKRYGAFWITDQDTLERISEEAGGDCYILPSSVHECMVCKAEVNFRPDELQVMVSEINRTQVEPEEVLTDSVYYYSQEKRILTVAARKDMGFS